jgi:hypothetical protein
VTTIPVHIDSLCLTISQLAYFLLLADRAESSLVLSATQRESAAGERAPCSEGGGAVAGDGRDSRAAGCGSDFRLGAPGSDGRRSA